MRFSNYDAANMLVKASWRGIILRQYVSSLCLPVSHTKFRNNINNIHESGAHQPHVQRIPGFFWRGEKLTGRKVVHLPPPNTEVNNS
jgi:hypothetical protein